MYIALILHLLITLMIGAIYSINKEARKRLFVILIPLCLPVTGYFIALFLLYKIKDDKNYKETIENKGMSPLIFTSKNTDENIKDITSLQAAINLNSSDVKKYHIKKFLEMDFDDRNAELLREAVRDEDIELAHYASVAINDMQKRLNGKIHYMSKACRDNPSLQNLKKYSKVLEEYLESNLSNNYYEKKYRKINISILEKILLKEKTRGNYSKMISNLLAEGEYEKASRYADLYLNEYKCEDSYISLLAALMH